MIISWLSTEPPLKAYRSVIRPADPAEVSWPLRGQETGLTDRLAQMAEAQEAICGGSEVLWSLPRLVLLRLSRTLDLPSVRRKDLAGFGPRHTMSYFTMPINGFWFWRSLIAVVVSSDVFLFLPRASDTIMTRFGLKTLEELIVFCNGSVLWSTCSAV